MDFEQRASKAFLVVVCLDDVSMVAIGFQQAQLRFNRWYGKAAIFWF